MTRATYSATPLALARSSPTRRYTGFIELVKVRSYVGNSFVKISTHKYVFGRLSNICRVSAKRRVRRQKIDYI